MDSLPAWQVDHPWHLARLLTHLLLPWATHAHHLMFWPWFFDLDFLQMTPDLTVYDEMDKSDWALFSPAKCPRLGRPHEMDDRLGRGLWWWALFRRVSHLMFDLPDHALLVFDKLRYLRLLWPSMDGKRIMFPRGSGMVFLFARL